MSRTTVVTVYGFIICEPGLPSDALLWTFGRTSAEAWDRYLTHNGRSPMDRDEKMMKRHRLSQRGYQPRSTQMVIGA